MSYERPEFHGTTERIEVVPEDVGQAMLYYEDGKTRVPIGIVYCEHDAEGDGFELYRDGTSVPTKSAANVALLANSYRVLAAAMDVLQAGFALCDKLAAPSIVVTTTDGHELARGDVLGELEDKLRELDRKVDESCDVGGLP